MKTTKTISLMILMIVFFSGFFSLAKAQDRYYYYVWDNLLSSNANTDAYYLVISDPIKNYEDASMDKRKDWETQFKNSANKQAGFKLVNSNLGVRGFGSESARSVSECRESIQYRIDERKEAFKNYNPKKPVKVIYVNLYEY